MGGYADKVTIEKIADNNGVKLIITPANELTAINLYAAIYNADGSLKNVEMKTCSAENGAITVPLTEPQCGRGESYKLLMWDTEHSPLIAAITDSDKFFD